MTGNNTEGLLLNPLVSGTNIGNVSILNNHIGTFSPKTASTNSNAHSIYASTTLSNSTISGNYIRIAGVHVSTIIGSFQYSSIGNNTLQIYSTMGSTAIRINIPLSSYSSNHVGIFDNSITTSGPNASNPARAIVMGFGPSADNVTVSGNDISIMQNNSGSIGIDASFFGQLIHNLSISGNHVTAANSSALFYVSDTEGELYDLAISGNYLANTGSSNGDGLYFSAVSGASVLNNTVVNTGYSVSISYSDHITFEGNYFSNSSNAPLLLSAGGNNMTFFHNDFVNYNQAMLVSGGPFSNISFNMSLPIGGNYWSGYTGKDGNGDGIGDTPYSVYTGMSDNFPLMKTWMRPHITFHEAGLFSGSSWSVTFNGHTITSGQSTITFYLTDGTYQNYSYTIHSVNGYKGGNKSGTYYYKGSSSNASVVYAPRYTFKLVETGLPSGTSWDVKVNGTMVKVMTSYLALEGTNGTTFDYTIYNNSLYYSNIYSGTATINGANETIKVTYAHYSYINGTITPAASSVYINGHKIIVNNGSFNETVTAGTYDVMVNDTGYSTQYDNFTISQGVTENLNISLNQTVVNKSPGGNSNLVYYIAGGVTALVIVGISVYLVRVRPKK